MMQRILFIAVLFSMTAMYAPHAIAQEQSTIIHVSKMTCGTCPISIRHRVLQLSGVHTASVDLNTATAIVTYEDSTQSAQAIAQTITDLGYPAIVEAVK